MKLTNLEGQQVRIGKTSITCMDESGKTCGIVRRLNSLQSCRSRTQEWDIWETAREAGLHDGGIEGAMNRVFENDGKYYYINDLRPLKWYEDHIHVLSGFEQDAKNYAKRIEIAEKAAETMKVINCYIQPTKTRKA